MLKLRTHLITKGRFYKAGVYKEGQLPNGFGEEVDVDDEPVRSKVDMPSVESKQEAEAVSRLEAPLKRKLIRKPGR
jgi:hypothetical protein